MKNKYILKSLNLFALITIFGLGVFAQPNASAAAVRVTQRWIPTSVYGEKVNDSKAFLELNDAERRVTGNAGCNTMFGSFKKTGRNLKFSGIGTTRMFCADRGAMRLETKLLRSLNETTRFQASGGTLKLYAGRKLVSVFKPAAANVADGELETKKWMLESIRGKALPKIETAAFIVFDRQKQSAGGNTSCNSFGGSYTVEGRANLKISEIISTQRACIEDERMNVERSFLDNLQKADRYAVKNNKLNLYQGEKLLLTFRGENK